MVEELQPMSPALVHIQCAPCPCSTPPKWATRKAHSILKCIKNKTHMNTKETEQYHTTPKPKQVVFQENMPPIPQKWKAPLEVKQKYC